MGENENGAEGQPMNGQVKFDYLKGSNFRVVHVDGVTGGVAPSGRWLHASFFNERAAIPRSETYAVDQGKLGNLVASDSRGSIVREVEVDFVLDLETAKVLREWLDRAVATMELIQARPQP